MKHSLILAAIIALLSKNAFAQSALELLNNSKNKYKDVVVKEVLSVDTFLVYIDGAAERVKMIGLRGPGEAPKIIDERPQEGERGFIMERANKRVNLMTPLETQAFDFVRELLTDKRVRFEFDGTKTDKDHHTLAYVYLLEDDTFVNEEILKAGYAHLSIQPPNTKHATKLRAAYQEGREERRGLHSR